MIRSRARPGCRDFGWGKKSRSHMSRPSQANVSKAFPFKPWIAQMLLSLVSSPDYNSSGWVIAQRRKLGAYSRSGSGAECSTVKSAKVSSTRQPARARLSNARPFDFSDGNVTVPVSESPWRATETSSGRGRDLRRRRKKARLGLETSSQNSRHLSSNDSVVRAPGGLMPRTLIVRDACENILEGGRDESGLPNRPSEGMLRQSADAGLWNAAWPPYLAVRFIGR
jgi:hypothetical protein